MFTDSPLTTLEAEAAHRAHAIIEQVHADLRSGPFAHAPSFAANSAWLVLAAIAFNLTRATGTLASAFHGTATTSGAIPTSSGPRQWTWTQRSFAPPGWAWPGTR